MVTASEDQTARLWDAATGKALVTLEGHTGPVISAAFSPDGTRVVTASWDQTARLWDAATGKALVTLDGHTERVYSAAFSPDGTRVVTASDDQTARLWDAATGKALVTLEGHTDGSLGGVQPGRHAGGHGVLRSRPRGCGTRPRARRSPPWKVTRVRSCSAAFSPDGTRVVTAASMIRPRGCGTRPRARRSSPWKATGAVWSAAFSPDGTRVVTASGDNTARLWDAAGQGARHPGRPHGSGQVGGVQPGRHAGGHGVR